MEKKKIYKWAKGKDAIELLKKEGGNNIYQFSNTIEIFYMPFDGGIIDICYIDSHNVANYIKSHGIEIKPKEILNDVERKYLSNVCRPFMNKVIGITKKIISSSHPYEYIRIECSDDEFSIYMYFPNFKKGTMYRGMELNKNYTPKELKLK